MTALVSLAHVSKTFDNGTQAFGPIDVGPYSDGSNFPLLVHKGEEYRTDSSLLVVEGCIEDTCDCARRYYNWNGRRFNLLLRQATPIPPKCKK